jgi:hypothetical protein
VNSKGKLAVGTAAALLVAGGGAAIAATKFGSPKEESQAVIADAARQLGIAPSDLSNALKKALENRVDAAVAAGRLTKAEGDALKARIDSGDNVPLILPGLGLGDRFDRGFGFGFGFPFGFKPLDENLDAAATYLGITQAQLRTELNNGKTLAQIATDHGKTADGLVQALYDAQKKDLDAAVSAGKLTQSQEDQILADLKDRLTNLVNGNVRIHVGPGLGLGPFEEGFDAAATYLGLTEAQLRDELEPGKTLAEVATAHGKSVDGLVDALLKGAEEKLDQAVAAGKLTEAEADSMLAGLKERITDFVNGRFPGPFGGYRERGFRLRPPAPLLGPPAVA